MGNGGGWAGCLPKRRSPGRPPPDRRRRSNEVWRYLEVSYDSFEICASPGREMKRRDGCGRGSGSILVAVRGGHLSLQ